MSRNSWSKFTSFKAWHTHLFTYDSYAHVSAYIAVSRESNQTNYLIGAYAVFVCTYLHV